MTGQPHLDRRYQDDDRQGFYGLGFAQMRDHDAGALLERFAGMGPARLAAALFGASDALAELAEQQEDAVLDALEERPPA